MRGIDWLSDADGKALLRRLLAEASTPDADYLRLASLRELED
jgi:hypothetical protein